MCLIWPYTNMRAESERCCLLPGSALQMSTCQPNQRCFTSAACGSQREGPRLQETSFCGFRKMQQLVGGKRSEESARELQQGEAVSPETAVCGPQPEVRGHEEGVEPIPWQKGKPPKAEPCSVQMPPVSSGQAASDPPAQEEDCEVCLWRWGTRRPASSKLSNLGMGSPRWLRC